jgi:CheY-like chemotaxis protein
MQTEGTTAARLRILIVESDWAIREVLTDLLRELGQDATSVSNSGEALTLLEHGQFDLMLVAHPLSESHSLVQAVNSLSEDDGLALAKTAREDDPQLKVILLTGLEKQESAKTALDNGVIDLIIAKPFTVWDLEEALMTLSV